MGASKRYKGKMCPYCGLDGISTTADHVIARAFFLEEDRANLPKVPSCGPCNNRKSQLEAEVSSVLMVASQHVEADKYRKQMVVPRIARNEKIQQKLRLDDPPQWVNIDGLFQPVHPVFINSRHLNELMQFIVRGLYLHHFGDPLSSDFYPDVNLYHSDGEVGLLASVSDYFPTESLKVTGNLGRGSFTYSGVRSPMNANFSVWRFAWHGGILLYGEGGVGVDHWVAFTRPTEQALLSSMD